jgi:hypothetical protein
MLNQGRWRGKIHETVRWFAGDSAADAVIQVRLSRGHHVANADVLLQVFERAIGYFTAD